MITAFMLYHKECVDKSCIGNLYLFRDNVLEVCVMRFVEWVLYAGSCKVSVIFHIVHIPVKLLLPI